MEKQQNNFKYQDTDQISNANLQDGILGDFNRDKKEGIHKKRQDYSQGISIINDVPAKSLTELEQEYYNSLQSGNAN
jgi:hypothetical protein